MYLNKNSEKILGFVYNKLVNFQLFMIKSVLESRNLIKYEVRHITLYIVHCIAWTLYKNWRKNTTLGFQIFETLRVTGTNCL